MLAYSKKTMDKSLLFASIMALSLLMVSCKPSVPKAAVPDYDLTYEVAGVSFEMVKLPAGYLTLGLSADNRRKIGDTEPRPTVLDGFVISAEPVTTALWTAVMGSNPGSSLDPAAPVDRVSYVEVQRFISRLSKLTGKVFSMPTEAQWEYAGKSLAPERFSKVGEWCSDSFAQGGEAPEEPGALMKNPQGPKEGDVRVVRNLKERVGIGSHTSKAAVGFSLVQPTEEVLSAEILGPLEGTVQDREPVDAGSGGKETFTVGVVSFKMVRVKGGEFTMGYQQGIDTPYRGFEVPDNEKVPHKVTLDDFALGETEVTVGLWSEVMGGVPYLNDPKNPDKAVGNVSWYDAQVFIIKLNQLTGRKFRLPTEAEWEYAARGGSKSHYFAFSGSGSSDAVMWNYDNSGNGIHEVARKNANELGIYDLSGNVWEWCFDRWSEYAPDAVANPTGGTEGTDRTLRGGSYASKWTACRVSNRSKMPARNIKGSFGLRLAL